MKNILSILIVFTMLFSILVPAFADTYTFQGASDSDWANTANWTTGVIAGAGDTADITASVDSISSGTASVTDANFSGWAYLGSITLTVSGMATFFEYTGNQSGTISGNATFNGNSSNWYMATIDGDATFNDYSLNDGTVTGTAKFNYASGGWCAISSGMFWGCGTAGSIVDSDGNPITAWAFDDGSNHGLVNGDAFFYTLSYNAADGTVTGGAYFNYDSVNYGTVHSAIFDNSSYNSSGGVVQNSAEFHEHSYNSGTVGDGATFNDDSYNDGYVSGTAAFNNGSSNSGSGTVNGNAEFNDTSSNFGNVSGTAQFNYAVDGVCTIADGGIWGSGTASSIVDSNGNPITSWIFDGSSYNYGTVTGDAEFNDASENATTITGDATFNDSAYSTGGTISGNVLLNTTGTVNMGSKMDGAGKTLTMSGPGTVTLTGKNTHTGLTTVGAGTLAYGTTNALGSGDVTVSGGILDIKGYSDTVGVVTLSSGAITGTTGVLTGTSYAVESGTVSAILGGAAALDKTTAGTVTLSKANTYTGTTTISVGTLPLDATGTIAASSGVANSGTLEIQASKTIDSMTGLGATTLGANTLTIGDASGNSCTYGGIASGTGGLTKAGAGILTLSGVNAYTGATTVSAGTLVLDATAGANRQRLDSFRRDAAIR